MSILINEKTKIIVQGFTGKIGSFHAAEMIEYGSNIVGGVTPGKGGQKHHGLPVFNTVKDAVKATGAEASILFVPPTYAADSAMEAADAGIKVCVAITDGIPSHDMIRVKRYMRRYAKAEKMTLSLDPAPDILKSIKGETSAVITAFALETHDGENKAKRKMLEKGVNFIVLNYANEKGAGFDSSTNRVTIFSKTGDKIELKKDRKDRIAQKIIDFVLQFSNQSELTK